MNSNGVDPTEDDCCIDANILNDIYVAVQSYDDNEVLLDNRTDDANDASSTENEICNKTDDKKYIMTDYVKQFKLSDFNIKLRRVPLDEADNYVITTNNNNDVTNTSNNDGIIVVDNNPNGSPDNEVEIRRIHSNTENSSFNDKNKSRRVMKRKLPPDSLYDSSEDDVPLMVRTTRRKSVSSVASNNNNQNKRRRRIKKKRVSSSSVDDSNNNETGKKFEDQTKKSSLTIDKDYSKINKMKDFKRTESGAADINETTTKRKIRKVPRNIKKNRLIDYSDSSEHDDGPSAKSNESTTSSVDKVVDGKIKVIQNGGDEMNEIVEANSTEPFATNVVEGNNTLGEQIGNETSSGNDNRKIKKTRLSSCPDKNHVSSTELKSTRLTDEIVENPVQADINIIVGRSVLSSDDDDNIETGIKFKDETKSSSTIDKDYSKNKKMKDFKRTESGAADINETTTKRKIRKVPRNIKENRLISYSDSSEHDGPSAKSNESTRSSVDKVVDGKNKVIQIGGDEMNEIVEANSTEPFATNVFVEGNNTLGEEIGNETSARYDSRKIKETRLSSCPDKNDVSSTELKSTRLTVEIVEKPVDGEINIIVEDNGDRKTGLFKANSTEPSTTNIVEDNNAIDECAPNVVSNSSKINVSSKKKRLNAKLESDRKTTSDLAEEMMLLKLNTENTSSPSCSALLLDDTQTKRDPKEDNSYDAVDIRAKEREDKNVENIATASENIANVDGEDELIGLRNLVADADLRNENCPKFFTNCDSIQKRTNNCTFSGESSIIGFTETVSTNVTQSLHTSLSSPSAQIIDCIDHLVEYAKIENRLSDDHVKLLTKWKCVIQSRKQHEIAFDRIENVIQYVRKIPSASSSDMEGLNNIKIVIEEFLNKTQ